MLKQNAQAQTFKTVDIDKLQKIAGKTSHHGLARSQDLTGNTGLRFMNPKHTLKMCLPHTILKNYYTLPILFDGHVAN